MPPSKCPNSSADFQSAVSQVSNLRRLGLVATLCRLEVGDTAGWKPALVCPAGVWSIGMKGSRRGLVTPTVAEPPGCPREATTRKGGRQTFDRRNTNGLRGRMSGASRRARAKPESHWRHPVEPRGANGKNRHRPGEIPELRDCGKSAEAIVAFEERTNKKAFRAKGRRN